MDDSTNDIPRYSAGHADHEWTSWACIDAMFPYLEEKYAKFLDYRVDILLADVDNSKMMEYAVQNEHLDYKATHSSSHTLRPQNKLNDEIVNAYFKLFQCHKHVYTFDTYFYKKMCESLAKNIAVADCFKFLKRIDLSAYQLLLCPINENDHWTLIAVNIPEKTIKFFDSLKNGKRGADEISWFLESLNCNRAVKSHSKIEWTIDTPDVPQQENATDCGVFLCQIACDRALGLQDFGFSQNHVDHARREMVFEIDRGALLPHDY